VLKLIVLVAFEEGSEFKRFNINRCAMDFAAQIMRLCRHYVVLTPDWRIDDWNGLVSEPQPRYSEVLRCLNDEYGYTGGQLN